MAPIKPIQIRMARAALGWELKQLALRIGATYQTVSRIENGLSHGPKLKAKIQQTFEENGLRFINTEDGIVGVVFNPFSIDFHETVGTDLETEGDRFK